MSPDGNLTNGLQIAKVVALSAEGSQFSNDVLYHPYLNADWHVAGDRIRSDDGFRQPKHMVVNLLQLYEHKGNEYGYETRCENGTLTIPVHGT